MRAEISSLSGRRALVTGAAGFIGSHLVEALARQGAVVRALIRYDSRASNGWLDEITDELRGTVEIVRGDVRDGASVERSVAGCDLVFHLAALVAIPYSYVAPEAYVGTNVVGALNILDAARRHDVARVVVTSTSEVYGTAQYVPIDERHPLHPQSPYAASKAASDLLAQSYHAAYGTPVVVLRPFNTYGPRQSLRAVIPTIAAQLLAGGPVRIGAVEPTRDFCHVSDTVDGFLRAATVTGVEGATIHLGSGTEISIGDLAALIADIIGTPIEMERDEQRVRPPSSEVERLLSDPATARAKLGWEARVGLREGLASTIEWLRAHRPRARVQEYVV